MKNNIDSIDQILQMDENDVEVDKIMPDDKEKDPSKKRYVTKNRDVSKDPLNLFKHDNSNPKFVLFRPEKEAVIRPHPDPRIDTTPGIYDPRWRYKVNLYNAVDMTGDGKHKKVLKDMEAQGSEKDKQLLQVLHDVTGQDETEVPYDDDYDDDDYEENDESSQNDGSPTSEYDSAKSKISEEPKMDDDSLTSPYDISATSLDTQQKDINMVPNQPPPPPESDVTKVDGNQNHYVAETETESSDTTASDSSNKEPINEVKTQTGLEVPKLTAVDAGQEKHYLTEVDRDVRNSSKVDCETGENVNANVVSPSKQVIEFSNLQDDIVDLSGQVLIDAQTGLAYNIEDIDITQFKELYVVNTDDNPLQEYKTMRIQLIDEDAGAVKTEIEVQEKITKSSTKEVNENGKEAADADSDGQGEKHVVKNAEDPNPMKGEKRVVTNAEDPNQMHSDSDGQGEKRVVTNVTNPEKRYVTKEEKSEDLQQNKYMQEQVHDDKVKNDEKEEKTHQEVKAGTDSEGDVKIIASFKRKKIIETIDIITSSSSDDTQKKKNTKVENTSKKRKHDYSSSSSSEETSNRPDECTLRRQKRHEAMRKLEEERDVAMVASQDQNSPDSRDIQFSKNSVLIKDQVPRRRAEIREQYGCSLARKFISNNYRCPKDTSIGPEFDFFEDLEDLPSDDQGSDTSKCSLTEKSDTSNCKDEQ